MLDEITHDLQAIYSGFDIDAFKIALATVIANQITQRPASSDDEFTVEVTEPLDPVWMMLTGSPGSGKTEILRMVGECEGLTYEILKLTSRTLASGKKGVKHLLPQLVNKTILVKDLSAIFSRHPGEVGEIVDQFRQIYDGTFKFDWGSGQEPLKWRGKVGFLGASTREVYATARRKLIASAGERFLYMPMKEIVGSAARKQVVHAAITNLKRDGTMRREIRLRVRTLLEDLTANDLYYDEIEIPDEVTRKLEGITNLATRMRTPVTRDRMERTITEPPDIESVGRMGKALDLLTHGLARIEYRTRVETHDVALVRRAAFGGMGPVRTAIVLHLFKLFQEDRPPVIRSEIQRVTKMPHTTIARELENLEALNVIESVGMGARAAWRLVGEVAEELRQVLWMGET